MRRTILRALGALGVMQYLLLAVLGVLLFSAHRVDAQTITTNQFPTFTWTAPTKRTDGSALAASEIEKYTIVCDGSVVANPGQALTSFKLTVALPAGAHTCYMTVTDTAGTPSAMSNTVNFTVVLAPPNPPSGVSVN